jgi:hypothetical protein
MTYITVSSKTTGFPFHRLLRLAAITVQVFYPLWREDGSVICSAICQWSESRRTHNHTLLSHLRLLGSLSVASYDSQGLRLKYSYPPPHRETTTFKIVWIYKTLTSSFVCCIGVKSEWAVLGCKESPWRFVSSLNIPHSTICAPFHHFKMAYVSFFVHKSLSWSP